MPGGPKNGVACFLQCFGPGKGGQEVGDLFLRACLGWIWAWVLFSDSL